MASGQPAAQLIVDPGTPRERAVPIYDRLFVGRECHGIQPRKRLLIDEPSSSRNHLEIRVEPGLDVATVVDTSTNGTRLNGVRIERGLPVPLASGDRLRIGQLQFEYRSDVAAAPAGRNPALTTRDVTLGPYITVVGDIIGFSTIAQVTPSAQLLGQLDVLFGELRVVLEQYRGTLGNLVGDAFFAVWEQEAVPDAAEQSLRFAVAGAARVEELRVRLGDGPPARMGWGASIGEAAVTTISRSVVSIVGDAANVAFRLSALAGRDGRPEILVTEELCAAVGDTFSFGALDHLAVKGRSGTEAVRGLHSLTT